MPCPRVHSARPACGLMPARARQRVHQGAGSGAARPRIRTIQVVQTSSLESQTPALIQPAAAILTSGKIALSGSPILQSDYRGGSPITGDGKPRAWQRIVSEKKCPERQAKPHERNPSQDREQTDQRHGHPRRQTGAGFGGRGAGRRMERKIIFTAGRPIERGRPKIGPGSVCFSKGHERPQVIDRRGSPMSIA